MSDPTADSVIKAFKESRNHYRLPLDVFCETLIAEVERLRQELYMRTRSLEEEMKMKQRGAHPDPIIDAAERVIWSNLPDGLYPSHFKPL